MTGYVRVTNKRYGIGPKADDDEIVVPVDRTNPILGNPHVLRNKNDPVERARVIAAYGRDLLQDIAQDGPKSKAIDGLVDRVIAGEQICLECWCAPRDCHANLIQKEVERRVARRMNPRPPLK